MHDQPIRALSTGASYLALGLGVGLRSLWKCADHSHTLAGQHVLEGERKLLVVVTDQELRWRTLFLEFPRSGFAPAG